MLLLRLSAQVYPLLCEKGTSACLAGGHDCERWCLGGEEAKQEHGELLFFTALLRV